MNLGKVISWSARGLLLVAVCTGLVKAAEEKGSGPSFSELLPQAAKDMGTDPGAAYHSALAKALALQHGGVISSCVHTFGSEGAEPFEAVVVGAADGKLSGFTPASMTPLSKCIQGRLLHSKFPKPPFAPFHDKMRFSFKQE